MTRWSVQTLNEAVNAEIDALPQEMRARLARVASLIEEFGPFKVGMPHVRSLGDKLWEIRLSGRDGIARCIYVIATAQQVVIVHAFVKKTQKTPSVAIATAKKRAMEAGLT